MDSRTLQKFCKDNRLLSKRLTRTDVDLLFTRVKARGTKRITFEQFCECLHEMAAKKGVEYGSLLHKVVRILFFFRPSANTSPIATVNA